MTVKTQEWLLVSEKNPIAKMLLQETNIRLRVRDAGNHTYEYKIVHRFADVSLLILVKTAGLVVSLLMMQHIIREWPLKIATMIIVPVTLIQLWLLCYLLF
jgi:hypothetical protein